MKIRFFFLFILILLSGCKKKQSEPNNYSLQISENLYFTETDTKLVIHSGKFKTEIKKSDLPLKKIVLLSSSLTGYIAELGGESRITAIASPEYIYSEKITGMLNSGKIQVVGNEQKYDLEKIIALKPDAVITNYIEIFENSYRILRENGIRIIFLDEYRESDPLIKSAYLKVFGKFFSQEKLADSVFAEVRKNYAIYKNAASKANNKPKIIANEMYGNQWFMPGGKTFAAKYFKDANADYFLKNNDETRSIPLSFEQVFSEGSNAEVWVNAGNHRNKKELLAANPNYARLEVFQRGRVYTIGKRQRAKANDYFESGAVRADLVLRDYVKIFHPELFPNDSLVYMQKISD